jgi:hypothetical protein
MPRCMVYMFGLSGEPIPLRLWDCQAWGTDAGTDIVYTHDEQWAFGDRDERATEKYAIKTFTGFRLNEVKAVSVIALCNQLDHILPPPLIPRAHPLNFPEKLPVGQRDYHPPAKNDEGNAFQTGPKQAGGSRRNKGGRPADTDAKQDLRIAEAWQTGRYKSREDLGKAFQMTKGEVIRALDRHRKRPGKTPPRKRRQEH